MVICFFVDEKNKKKAPLQKVPRRENAEATTSDFESE